jgi:hypothetical protein
MEHLTVPHCWVGSCPYKQILDLAKKNTLAYFHCWVGSCPYKQILDLAKKNTLAYFINSWWKGQKL